MTDVDVVVVGCGPVGALTANLLGRLGVRTLVVERETLAHGQPRAFSCDDEALRIYQSAGLVDAVRPHMYAAPLAAFVNARGRDFAEIAMSEVDFGFGYSPLNFFDQPRLEAALRGGFDRFDHVALRLGHEVTGLTQDADGVDVRIRSIDGEATVRARYVLGCDGASSTTRALAGIALTGSSYVEPWLAVSGDVPADAVRQDRTQFVCDWRRPAFVSPAVDGSYRMEFMLRPGETPADIEKLATVHELIEPYVDPARFAIRRAVVYSFHNLVADAWRADRVFLLGDAAHQMPPFMGQGLCSGLRDAANLAWKLGLVLSGCAGADLLDSYERERRPHAEAMAAASVRIGHVFLARNRWLAGTRDALLRAVQRVPRVRRFVRHFEFKPAPVLDNGILATGVKRGAKGTMFPQPLVATDGDPLPLDDLIGTGFAVIGPGVGPDLAADPVWRGLPVRFLRLAPGSGSNGSPVVDIVDGPDGTLGRWFARHKADVAVLRPDRFVFGVASRAGAPALGTALRARLHATA